MIRVGKSLVELDNLAANHFTELNSEFQLSVKLQSKIIKSNGAKRAFYQTVYDHLTDIMTGKPDRLESLITLINPLYQAYKSEVKSFRTAQSRTITRITNERVFSVFNYSLFTSSDNATHAYKLARSINSNVCPYCNTQYTFTIKKKEARTRPQFDHFYQKSKYPYLALSFYNLVPSCYVCNSNLKNSKDFKYSSHIHPYMEDINDTHIFRTKVNAADFLLGKKGFDLKLEPIPTAEPTKLTRAKRNVSNFILEDQYQFHKEYVGEIIKKAYLYNESKLNELLIVFEVNGHKLFDSKEEIIDMIFGDYIHEDKLHTRILSKLTRDVLDEFNIKVK
jgi:hypothetical protein